jgi:hypothetical protein
LIPAGACMLETSNNPLHVELKTVPVETISVIEDSQT